MLWIAIAIVIIALDQISKLLIIGNINLGQQIPIINDFFYITHWKNTGAAWGMFQNGRFFFIPFTIALSIVLIRIHMKSDNRFLKLALTIILGGAMGNFIDRVYRGSVVDFLQFFFGSYQFPIFNIADSFVVIGTVLMVCYILFMQKENQKIESQKNEIEKKEVGES
ncbi:signal peptidase II [Pseudobacteroides cellulosolvens]|uniref:Lipoprotein signal peptidase n=1 Tax=Pseudobacteroides cellulosolvens ATCC 35603 = DSM 2933 TaxID=398512 RepID=A0A0L6JL56_9FIRM|nr:signal peptidase II [Pseudobacteroides cellulosolvens]KNY26463.1 Lipoprotein signal peptidase [Pseudobacteroides cellulosolvens ATCC 35603 = DSM 2933]